MSRRRTAVNVDFHLDDDTTDGHLRVESMRHVDGSVSIAVHATDPTGDDDDIADQVTIFGQFPMLRHIHRRIGEELARLEAGGR